MTQAMMHAARTLSVEDAFTAKRECEQAILHAIARFEHQTGLSVHGVTLTHEALVGGSYETLCAELDVRFE